MHTHGAGPQHAHARAYNSACTHMELDPSMHTQGPGTQHAHARAWNSACTRKGLELSMHTHGSGSHVDLDRSHSLHMTLPRRKHSGSPLLTPTPSPPAQPPSRTTCVFHQLDRVGLWVATCTAPLRDHLCVSPTRPCGPYLSLGRHLHSPPQGPPVCFTD